MIRLEILITTVHYAEVLAANFLAFRERRKRFHRILLSYEVSEVIDFYRKVKHRKLSYIAKLVGYPAFFQITDEKGRETLKTSCEYVKRRLSEIGDSYLRFNSLYNAYKHGFRVGVAQSAPPPDFEPYVFILWPPDREKLDEAIVMRLGHPGKEIEMCTFMVSLLNAITETFIQRILNGKPSFTTTVFSVNGV